MLALLHFHTHLTPDERSALLGILVAVVGFVLNRKAKQIHVLVNSRMEEALKANKDQATEIGVLGTRIEALEGKLQLHPGEAIPTGQVETTDTTPGK